MMSEYFKTWRRKLGIFTLLIACVFTGGWFRSQSIEDEMGWFGWYCAASISNYFVIAIPMHVVPRDLPLEWFNGAATEHDDLWGDDLIRWRWFWGLIGIGTRHDQCNYFVGHCGAIVIPLSLLSAFLLLSRDWLRRCITSSVLTDL